MATDINDYEIRIWHDAVNGEPRFMAQVVEWPVLKADGETADEAAREISTVLALALKTAKEFGDPVPRPRRASARRARLVRHSDVRKGRSVSSGAKAKPTAIAA
ncbi:hypothetical protein AXK11_01120 [Cephaloticoccus primus]|uniref:HicB-like antitoxin of toxin-antitoxin system domain-containing protein n=1 Tax=Cephaloticoccus primus TaxID=1548207 RepID=A0A139SUL7_9BACT|nr:hypothetical protein [Cephaloticoccus primus]KXU38151.1 hypothetical protein AXK11_01120 [Cephaloticoccus primus]